MQGAFYQEESCECLEVPRRSGRVAQSLRALNGRLYAALLLKAAMPTVYTTTRIYFLGQMPQANGVDIASQLYWVSLILEVMEEALIVPLYPCIGETISQDVATWNKVRTGLFVTLLFYTSFSAIVVVFAEPLVDGMASRHDLRADTVKYIRWEMVAAVIQGLERFTHVIFVLLKRDKVILVLTLLQALLTVFFDYILVSDLPGSLRVGVIGLAWSNICTYALLLMLAYQYLPAAERGSLTWAWLVSWWRVGRWAALASLIRNLSYVIFVARMVNVLHQSGNYWIANNFIWKWLLLLFLPLAELLKQEVSCRARVPAAHIQILPAYLLLSLLLFVVWLATLPGWKVFFQVVLNVEKPEMALEIANWLLPFYFVYMFAGLLDSIFYGLGLTNQLAWISVCTNLGVYGSAFLLYRLGVFSLSIHGVMCLFGSGIVVGTALRFIGYCRWRQTHRL